MIWNCDSPDRIVRAVIVLSLATLGIRLTSILTATAVRLWFCVAIRSGFCVFALTTGATAATGITVVFGSGFLAAGLFGWLACWGMSLTAGVLMASGWADKAFIAKAY